jgi:hypothetical protein
LFVVIMISSFFIHRLLFWSLQGGNRLLDEAVNGWGCWRKKTVFLCRRKYEPAISFVSIKTDIRKNAIVYRRKVMFMAFQIARFFFFLNRTICLKYQQYRSKRSGWIYYLQY